MYRSKIRIVLIISLVGIGLGILLNINSQKKKVVFCDVGQGDGALVIQGSFQMIIDSGPDNKMMLRCLSKYLPFWDKKIEVAVITHGDSDHSGGLKSVQNYYNVQKIYSNELAENDIIRYGEIQFEVLSSGTGVDTNLNSVVGMLDINNRRFLLMADAPMEVEQRLIWRNDIYGKVDILKVSHHGSALGTSEELLKVVKPEVAIISVGKDNRFGHPAKEVLERLEKFEVRIRRTDEEGDVVFKF